jgi:NAD(P)H-dependent FMN reductase
MPKIMIIAGSTRPGRFNVQPATWIAELAKQETKADIDFVDLTELNLPFLNEANPPSSGVHEQPHTIAWAKRVAEADGFVFVTPEYNHSYSPALKNAIDYLYGEWNYKPLALIITGKISTKMANTSLASSSVNLAKRY